jgi:translation elongation factor EF-G
VASDAKADETLAHVLKTYYTPQGGKLSLVRVWQGELKDGDSLNGERMGGLYELMGQQQNQPESKPLLGQHCRDCPPRSMPKPAIPSPAKGR